MFDFASDARQEPRLGLTTHETFCFIEVGCLQDFGEWAMMLGRRVAVVMPAYNAERTLERTYKEIPEDVVDDVILTDDGSHDRTVEMAQRMGIFTIIHPRNMGYGANQKTCYANALRRGADIVVMLHPDYQYSPRLIPAMASMIASGEFDVVLGSRILGTGALKGGMPVYKYVANRALTFTQNLLIGQKLSEYHTGFRAWSREVLQTIPFQKNSDDFVFDNQMLLQALFYDYRVGEISCPTRYFSEASSINFRRSVVYGLGCLRTGIQFRAAQLGIAAGGIFKMPREPAHRPGPTIEKGGS